MTICSKCILQNTLPYVEIGEDGVCNVCKNSKPQANGQKKNQLKIMEDLFDSARKNAWPYQVLVAYSGGKDSSYLLYHLKKEYKLNVLALSVVHPFMRKEVQDTLSEITKNIGVDLIKFSPQNDIIRAVIRQGIKDPERYGHRQAVGCSLCGAFHYLIPFVFATKMGIPIVATGSDPAQSVGYPPLVQPRLKNKLKLAIIKAAAVFAPERIAKKFKMPFLPDNILTDIFGEGLTNTIYQIKKTDLLKQKRMPTLISPLSIIDYDFRKKAKKMEQLGIVEQKKTHSLLSNCTLHHFFAYLSYKRYDCHPYEENFSFALRQGYPTFVEQFAKQEYESTNPRDDTLRFLEEYKKALFLIADKSNHTYDDLFFIVKQKCHFMSQLLGEELFGQATKDMLRIHEWAKYFDIDLTQY